MSFRSTILDQILNYCFPEIVIIHNEKLSLDLHETKSADFCIVVNCKEKLELMRKLYLSIETDIPFNLTIYTGDEWRNLTIDHSTYASYIKEKGIVIYEQSTQR